MKGFFSAFKDYDAKLERICRETGNTKKLEALLKKKHPDLNKIFFVRHCILPLPCANRRLGWVFAAANRLFVSKV